MKRKIITIALAMASTLSFAQTFKEWQDAETNAINRAPMHTNYFAFESAEAAAKGCKKQSENYLSLDGTWKFN